MHPRPSPIAASLYTLRDMNADVIILHGPHGCCFRTGRLLENDGVRVVTTAMGADPVAMLSDLHLADDGDVGKLFDFTAGVCAVSELVDVPLVAGSTLRVGGDMKRSPWEFMSFPPSPRTASVTRTPLLDSG